MSSIVISGDTSGTITIVAPAVSGTNTLTLPANTGTVLTSASTQSQLPPNIAGNGPAFAAYNSTAQSFTNSVVTKAQFNTKVFDTANCFDNTTNYRFTPTVAGYYFVSGIITMNNASAGQGSYTLIAKNGTVIASASAGAVASVSYSGPQVTTLVYMNGTTDYVELYGDMIGATQNTIPTIFATGDGVRFSAFLARSA